MRMLRSLAVIGLALAAGLGPPVMAAPGDVWVPQDQRTAAPKLEFSDIPGARRQFSRFKGKVVVVNFWATWCAPCVEEMPSLMRLREKFAPQGLEVIAVNFQENAARIKPFLMRNGLDFPVVRDHDGSARTAWGVNVFPSSFVIGPDQKVAFVVVGEADWSGPTIEPRIRSILFP